MMRAALDVGLTALMVLGYAGIIAGLVMLVVVNARESRRHPWLTEQLNGNGDDYLDALARGGGPR